MNSETYLYTEAPIAAVSETWNYFHEETQILWASLFRSSCMSGFVSPIAGVNSSWDVTNDLFVFYILKFWQSSEYGIVFWFYVDFLKMESSESRICDHFMILCGLLMMESSESRICDRFLILCGLLMKVISV